MRKLFAVLALSALATFASAQAQVGGVTVVPVSAVAVSNAITAMDTEPVLIIKYFPGPGMAATAITPTVANVADTSITFTVGGAAYTGFECPISGAVPWGGVITVSDSACSDLGEVVDAINSTATTFTTGYFRAAIVSGVRADESINLLADAADTDANTVAGEIIYRDTSEFSTFVDGLVLVDISNLANEYFSARNIIANPFVNTRQVLYSASMQATNAGTLTDLIVTAVTRTYGSGKGCVAAASCGPNAGSSETSRVVWRETRGISTARGSADELINAGGLRGNFGEVFMARAASSAASSVRADFISGLNVTK
jgi:hypothetical protein